jgi:hypothetical protein
LLAGGLGRAEAKQHQFISHYAGTGVDGVIDTNGDSQTASVNTGIATTTLGRFVFQGEAEFLPPLKTNVTCPTGTLEFPLLQVHSALTDQHTGEQLLLTYTSGALCFDPTTLTDTLHAQGTFSGGTGRFVEATGPFEDNSTATLLVVDPHGHAFANESGTVTGTLTGVKDSHD